MNTQNQDEIRQVVREAYGEIASTQRQMAS